MRPGSGRESSPLEIPYTTDARPDTGLTNPKIGIWLFLASEVMLFGSLFSSYVLLRNGAASSTNNFLGLYFTMTGLHAIHVLGGMVVNGYLWGPGVRMWRTEPERFTNRVEVAGLYWHFVDVVWIFLFPVLYLL